MDFKTDIRKLYRHEKIGYIPMGSHFNFMPLDDIEHGPGMMKSGDTAVDMFGVNWSMTGLGATPTPNIYRAESVEECFEAIPSDETVDSQDWQGWADKFMLAKSDGEASGVFPIKPWSDDNATEVFIPAGLFERLHHLMGLENAMIALATEPDAVKKFTNEMVRYKKTILRNVKKYANPDIVFCMDDFGTSRGMFMSREMWLEYYFEPLREIVSYAHELGLFYEHHSCGYITPIFGDIVVAGADAINPVQYMNDLDYIAEKYGGKILIIGGANGQMLASGSAKDDDLVQNVRACVRRFAPTGCFLPEWMVQGAAPERVLRVIEIYVTELNAIGIECR